MKTIQSLTLVLLLVACDLHREDTGPDYSLDLITQTESPAVLKPGQFSAIFSEAQPATLPLKGNLRSVAGGKYLLYEPQSDFEFGNDRFEVSLFDENGQSESSWVSVEVLASNDPTGSCHNAGIYDHITLSPGESFVQNLLVNDYLCVGQNLTSGAVSMDMLTSDEGAGVEPLIALNLPNNSVTLSYTAPEDFVGTMQFVYEMGANSQFVNHGKPMVDDNNQLLPDSFEVYVLALVTIEVIAD